MYNPSFSEKKVGYVGYTLLGVILIVVHTCITFFHILQITSDDAENYERSVMDEYFNMVQEMPSNKATVCDYVPYRLNPASQRSPVSVLVFPDLRIKYTYG